MEQPAPGMVECDCGRWYFPDAEWSADGDYCRTCAVEEQECGE